MLKSNLFYITAQNYSLLLFYIIAKYKSSKTSVVSISLFKKELLQLKLIILDHLFFDYNLKIFLHFKKLFI